VTLILALRHRDGLLLASDSQATAETAGQPTKQETSKLHVLGGKLAWGGSGSVGLIQRVQCELEPKANETAQGMAKHAAEHIARGIFPVVNEIQQKAIKEHVPPFGKVPQSVAFLFVGYAKDGPFILEVSASGTRQFHSVPLAAIGSGEIFAAHAMHAVAHYDVASLTRDLALAVAYRTIDDAIETAAFGLGGKVQLIAVTKDGAKALGGQEVKAVQDLVDLWKIKEVETLGSLSPAAPPSESAPAEEPPSE
jgi:20S proteasome alpha/beta subunit